MHRYTYTSSTGRTIAVEGLDHDRELMVEVSGAHGDAYIWLPEEDARDLHAALGQILNH